jgi:Glycine/serine hydroxymethyltransferase
LRELPLVGMATWASVQPHSRRGGGCSCVFWSFGPGDTFLGGAVGRGGHLTHGAKVNFSGRNFKAIQYGLHPETGEIDYEAVSELALKHKPTLVRAGFSAYMGMVDWTPLRDLAESGGAYLRVETAHVSGWVAAEVYPNPMEYAHVVTSTTHKSLRGPRSGIILTNEEEELQKK